MKIILLISVLLGMSALSAPYLSTIGMEYGENEPAGQVEQSVQPEIADNVQGTSGSVFGGLSAEQDSGVTLTLLTGGKVVELSLRDYLIGVTAAEMPANFYDEALKAQAVAARTYTYYKAKRSDGTHPEADACDDPSHCKAWLTDSALREKWGGSYDVNLAKIAASVDSTDGLCAMYDDEPILAVFHSSSGGFTEDSSNVWSKSLPYLVSVQSPESSSSVPDFVTEAVFTVDEFKRIAVKGYPDMTFGGELVSDAERSAAGRIISVKLGGVRLSGTEFRMLFGLRSANISWEIDNDEIRLTVTGYGHGVGLSQFGANEFARNGASFEDILGYYYRGISVKTVSESL
jgi:stage II sporulation protein D